MSDYQVLSQDEQDDIIVGFMLSQEKDKYCHAINLARYETILANLEPGQWRDRIEKLRDETSQRLSEVNSIIEATQVQLPPKERIEAAKTRLRSMGVGGT